MKEFSRENFLMSDFDDVDNDGRIIIGVKAETGDISALASEKDNDYILTFQREEVSTREELKAIKTKHENHILTTVSFDDFDELSQKLEKIENTISAKKASQNKDAVYKKEKQAENTNRIKSRSRFQP